MGAYSQQWRCLQAETDSAEPELSLSSLSQGLLPLPLIAERGRWCAPAADGSSHEDGNSGWWETGAVGEFIS